MAERDSGVFDVCCGVTHTYTCERLHEGAHEVVHINRPIGKMFNMENHLSDMKTHAHHFHHHIHTMCVCV